jgi:UDP-glucose 4-epimerase
MTRFLLSLDQAVDTIFAAVESALPGETYVPKVASARVADIAEVMINERNIRVVYTGIRPGEKIHEVLVSEDECYRTIERKGYLVICPILPELRRAPLEQLALNREYSSEHVTLDGEGLRALLVPYIESEMKRIRA